MITHKQTISDLYLDRLNLQLHGRQEASLEGMQHTPKIYSASTRSLAFCLAKAHMLALENLGDT